MKQGGARVKRCCLSSRKGLLKQEVIGIRSASRESIEENNKKKNKEKKPIASSYRFDVGGDMVLWSISIAVAKLRAVTSDAFKIESAHRAAIGPSSSS